MTNNTDNTIDKNDNKISKQMSTPIDETNGKKQ